ncbi:hypothetical protein JCM10213_005402 [Rhodosporidiobolus nylandii]
MVAHLSYKFTHLAQSLRAGHLTNTLRNAFPSTATPAPTFDFTSNVFGGVSNAANSLTGQATALGMAAGAFGAGAGAGAAATGANGGAAGGAGGASSKAGSWSSWGSHSGKSLNQGQAVQSDSQLDSNADDELRAFASPSARRALLRRNRSPVGFRARHGSHSALSPSSPPRPSHPDLLHADEAGLSGVRLSGVEAQRMYHTAFAAGRKTVEVKEAELEADEVDLGAPATEVLSTGRRASISLSGLARSSAPLLSSAGLSMPVRPASVRALHTSASLSSAPSAPAPSPASSSRSTTAPTFSSTTPPSPSLPLRRRNSTSAVPSSSVSLDAAPELPTRRSRTPPPQIERRPPHDPPKEFHGFGWARGKSDEEVVQGGKNSGVLVSPEATERRGAILAAEKTGKAAHVNRAVQQYLADPSTWTIGTHNAAMSALHTTRLPNAPLDRIIELYNQLFSAEGLHPTRASYETIIRAFCVRDEEVRRNITYLERRVKKKQLANRARGSWFADAEAMEEDDSRFIADQEAERLAHLRSPEFDYFSPALQIFKALGQLGDRLQPEVVQRLMSCAADRGDVDVALALFERLEQSPHQRPSYRAYETLIRMYGAEKDAELVKEVFEAYLTARANGQIPQAEWGAASRRRFRPQSVKHAYDTAPEFVLDEAAVPVKDGRRSVDEWIWATAIRALFDAGDSAGAVSLLERILVAQNTPQSATPGYPSDLSARTVSLVVTGFIRSGDEASARKWFDNFALPEDGADLPDKSFFASALYAAVESPYTDLLNHIYRSTLAVASQQRPLTVSDFVVVIDCNLAKAASETASAEEKEQALSAIGEFRTAFERAAKAGLLDVDRSGDFRASTGLLSRIAVSEGQNGLFSRSTSTFAELANIVRYTMSNTPADTKEAREKKYRPRTAWALRITDAALGALGLRRSSAKVSDIELPPAGSPSPTVQQAAEVVSWTNKIRAVVDWTPEPALELLLTKVYLASRTADPRALGLSGENWYFVLEAFAHTAALTTRSDAAPLPFDFPGFRLAFDDFLASGAEIPVKPYNYELLGLRLKQSGMSDAEVRSFIAGMNRDVVFDTAAAESQSPVAPKAEEVVAPVEEDAVSIASGSVAPATSATAPSVADSVQHFPTPPSTPPSYFAELAPSPPAAPAPAPSPAAFDRNLGTKIEQLTFVGRAADATRAAAEAFNLAIAAAREGRFAHPESYGRLVEQLGRQHLVNEVRQMYLLAYEALNAMSSDPEAQSAAWVSLEDRMIVALAQAGELVDVGHHRDRLLQAGCAPSADAYAAMILNMKDTTDDAAVALTLFEESQRLNVRPNVYLFNTLISKLSRARRAKEALEYFELMKQYGLVPSSITYGAIINACCKTGDDVSAEFLFSEMVSRPDFKPRPPPYNTLIQHYVSTKPDRARALHYYNALVKAKVQPTEHTYKLLLDAYGATGPEPDLESMQQVFARLARDKRVRVSGAHWAAMINAYGVVAKDVDRAIAIFDSIPAHPTTANNPNGPLPDAVVYEALLNALIANGQADLCDKYLLEMKERSIRMTAYVCNSLIKGYTSQSLFDHARRIFAAMSEPPSGVASAGNHPINRHPKHHHQAAQAPASVDAPTYREPSTYEAMIVCELKAGETVRAMEVLKLAEQRAFPPAVIGRLAKLLADVGAEKLLQQ